MKNILKNIYAYAMVIYGAMFTGILMYQFLGDNIWVSMRSELVIAMTCVPAMVHGLKTLKGIWVAKALSKKDKEIEEIKQNYQLTIVDSAA